MKCELFDDIVVKIAQFLDLKDCKNLLNSSKKYGSDIFDRSIDALRESYLFVCFFSQDYNRSCYCRAELALAIEQNMSILNVIIDGTSLNDNSFELSNSIYSGMFYNY
jgi:hypothetical protein